MNRVRATMVSATAGALALGAWGMAPASAAPMTAGVERELDGRCSASSTWDFNVEREGKRIEVDVEVDTLRANRSWTVQIWHNGKRVTIVKRVTDRHGEIELERHYRNLKGKDRFTFKAVSRTGEVCRASVRI